MSAPIHTYGPKCLLSDDEPDLTAYYSSPVPPKARAQFFYASSLPIDDPFSPLSPPPDGQNFGSDRVPPHPFSARDNIALEDAWSELRRTWRVDRLRSKENISVRNRPVAVPRRIAGGRRRHIVDSNDDHESSQRVASALLDGRMPSHAIRSCDEAEGTDTHYEACSYGLHTGFMEGSEASDAHLRRGFNYRRRAGSSLGEGDTSFMSRGSASQYPRPDPSGSISGSPFIRAPMSRPQTPLGYSLESTAVNGRGEEIRDESHTHGSSVPEHSPLKVSSSQEVAMGGSESNVSEVTEGKARPRIPVGVSRLHLVELPNLRMRPIYWSPLHDISNVVRSTWFYKNTMLPVETELANRLEAGYIYFQPWTQTWQDELNSCVENGADAEAKVVYTLWPREDPKLASRPSTSQSFQPTPSEHRVSEGPSGETTGIMSFDENRAAGTVAVHTETIKQFINASAIYVDAKNAQILRPSLLPSQSRGRRPLSAIRKGRQIGIPVVRGFSRRQWDQIHPPKPSPVDMRRYVRYTQTQSTAVSDVQICYGCAIEGSRPTPSDLVLVIHGIGQKLSERIQSWHFTHAINSFRSSVNTELNSELVWPHVRDDHGGIMVLPINWRSTLSLEEAGSDSPSTNNPAANRFSLGDITPETIPAIRSLISDVMLDIPYYLSHHKPKMIQAVAKEANRVYRLWCGNNPGFRQCGRVHLIAHSLGSAMALDILSHQPTRVPDFDFAETRPHLDIFEFDTNNLFICGSPAGFFLLLNKATLLPRRGRNKPGSDGEDCQGGVVGEVDNYGCLAVDNFYNIMHTTDPIAYRVNAAVDTELASSLKTAFIPSTISSFWRSVSGAFRWGSAASSLSASTTSASSVVSKLPSNVELETHNFTREEIAERRMFLLNDNGQIDYFLSGGGGPLSIQYLNMLSAHSSYFTLTDFVRFVVIEVARRPGRDRTLPAFRAKKRKRL